MPIQQKHGKGGNPYLVHEDIAECIKHINALENMILRIRLQATGVEISGKLDMSGDHCVLNGR